MLVLVNIARVLSILAAGYAFYVLAQTIVEPNLMAPALAASPATSAVIAIVPYIIARMLGDMYRDSLRRDHVSE